MPPQTPDQTSSPWPAYGQIPGETDPASGTVPPAGSPSTPGVPPVDSPNPQSVPPAQGTPAQPESPYGAPSTPVSPAQGSWNGPGAVTQKLPGRGLPITGIVLGVLMMIILAPIVFFGAFVGGMNLTGMLESAESVTNGDTVTVDDSGSYILFVEPNDTDALGTCGLFPPDASTIYEMQYTASGGSTGYMVSGLEPGEYVLDCQGTLPPDAMGATGLNLSEESLANAGGGAFMWATVVGLLGLVLLIVGIVFLVRANKRRREIQRMSGQF
ncbi:MAG: hypothetical protein CSA82_03435 [Actinobacteria bacterium]|nr:MAG: hypothetical protein CSA82_03435 [Actinomycetota bacterium]